jgi:hypothetical protein
VPASYERANLGRKSAADPVIGPNEVLVDGHEVSEGTWKERGFERRVGVAGGCAAWLLPREATYFG